VVSQPPEEAPGLQNLLNLPYLSPFVNSLTKRREKKRGSESRT
jgi:hypothetical protein